MLRRPWLVGAFRSLGALASFSAPSALWAQEAADKTAARNSAVYLYKGADREARLLDAAKKEGALSVYTSLNTRDSGPIVEAFEKKYGVRTQLWRASSEKVVQRAVTEARAGRHSVDAFESNGPELEQLFREKLLSEFWSPYFKDLPPAAFPKHRHYVADRFNFFVLAWNTQLVKPEDVPSSYADLLLPKYKGKVGIEANDTDWFAGMVKAMGSDKSENKNDGKSDEKGLAYFRQLAATQPQVRTGHTLMGELLSSGEIAIVVSIYNHVVEKMIVRGAPVKWKALAPTLGRPNGVAVAKQAAHPHAALLFADFMLSPQGQQLIKERSRVPASMAVESHMNKFPYEMIDPVVTLDEDDKWDKLWSQLFLSGRKVQRQFE